MPLRIGYKASAEQSGPRDRLDFDAGFDHLVFHGPGHDQTRFLTAFATDIAPALRVLKA